MAPWKRHGLARLLGTCAYIFYRKTEDGAEETLAYLASLRSQMPHHTFINQVVDGAIQKIDAAAVNAVLAQSRCGLCLSAEEGAMYASMEYLLAGLPVVSTPNIGGRDVFSDPDFWVTAPDTPEAIRDAVSEVTSRNVPAALIRARTLERAREHRARLRSVVAYATGGKVMLPADLSDSIYRQMPVWSSGEDLAVRLGIEG